MVDMKQSFAKVVAIIMWYHRGCASVSQKLLQELTASKEPYLCLMCSRTAFKEEVGQLKSEIILLKSELKAIPSMQTSIETLHREITDLRSKINNLTVGPDPKSNASKKKKNQPMQEWLPALKPMLTINNHPQKTWPTST